jgi:hypothetical protein
VEVLRVMWQHKFEVIYYLVPNRGMFQKTIKGLFPIFYNWCRLHHSGRAARSLLGIVVVVIY